MSKQQPKLFSHVVKKSTLREGITVPKDFEEWFDSPEVGCKRDVTLVYDKDREVQATLRRLNNRARHVQIKYETAKQASFRDWLQSAFKASSNDAVGEVLAFRKISKDRYLLDAIPLESLDGANLRISRTFYHGGAERLIPYIPTFKEIPQVVTGVGFKVGETQFYYNRRLREGFVGRGWLTEQPIIEGFNLRYDHRKENVQLEVEFGNARSYYQDYIKFSIAFNEGLISLGGLIAPTADFANTLCDIGRQKAWHKLQQQGLENKPTYSGMMTYEKAALEFRHLKYMLNMPIVVMGIDYKD